MYDPQSLARQHAAWTRRYFLRVGAAGLAAGAAPWSGGFARAHAAEEPSPLIASREELQRAIAEMEYLTPGPDFGNVGRGDPVPSELSDDARRAAGLHPDTWQLEIVADPDTNARIERPMSKEQKTALDWQGLMRIAEKHAVRYLKVMTCNNINAPLGMGLWEGVPLRELVWMTGPKENIRRVFYYGYHNDKPEQMFRSSLALNRVLEDPPGELPVLVCYKLNGQWLSPKRGGPVRMLVPEAYGFKSVKWLQRIVLTNDYRANDTYAEQNNDIESWQKSFARIVASPEKVKPGQAFGVTGLAQVGIGGVSKVQIALDAADAAPLPDDPHFARSNWQDAEILPPPKRWGAELADAPLGDVPLQFDPAMGRPRQWPLRYTLVHWATMVSGAPAGKYLLRCRTIDHQGNAQPLPRPYPKSGRNAIHSVELVVDSTG